MRTLTDFVEDCLDCNRYKLSNQTPTGLLQIFVQSKDLKGLGLRMEYFSSYNIGSLYKRLSLPSGQGHSGPSPFIRPCPGRKITQGPAFLSCFLHHGA
ncbi:hypothetical protein CEXT_335821 [Caerostris extrusa]|uniref:Uncharacterized protein n=1 Tax=Caerostris extrusa TaxID=172846 RepID=A0AAV4M315_CAEEX|nr:hypothetical protein CEXT_335821 [Caerostris extrusa]